MVPRSTGLMTLSGTAIASASSPGHWITCRTSSIGFSPDFPIVESTTSSGHPSSAMRPVRRVRGNSTAARWISLPFHKAVRVKLADSGFSLDSTTTAIGRPTRSSPNGGARDVHCRAAPETRARLRSSHDLG